MMASTPSVSNYSGRKPQDDDTKWQTHANTDCPTKLYRQRRASLYVFSGTREYIYMCVDIYIYICLQGCVETC